MSSNYSWMFLQFLPILVIINTIKGQEMDFGVNYVTSYSKRYDKSSGLVHLSVLVDVPESGPTLAVYWQVNEGVVGVDEASFGTSLTRSGTQTTYFLVADTSYVRQVFFTTRMADRSSSIRFESFDWSEDYPSPSSFPIRFSKCSSTATLGNSQVPDQQTMRVDFKCNPPFSANDYNYPRVYWNMKFGLYLFNDSANTVYYKPLEEEIRDKRGDLLLSRTPRSLRRFPSDERIPGEDTMAFPVEDTRPSPRGLTPSRNTALTENTLSLQHELATITIGATPWAELDFSSTFLKENVVFLETTIDAPLRIGLAMVFSFVQKVPISKDLPSGVYLQKDGGKTFPQPSVVNCQAFGNNPPKVSITKNGKTVTKTENISVQEIRSPLFSTSYVTFVKKSLVNREADGQYSCFYDNPQGDVKLSDFSVLTRPIFLEDQTRMTEQTPGELALRLVVEGNGQMVVSCHVPVPDHMVLINKAEKSEQPTTTTLHRKEVTLTYRYPPEAVRPFDYFCTVRDEYGYHNTHYVHR